MEEPPSTPPTPHTATAPPPRAARAAQVTGILNLLFAAYHARLAVQNIRFTVSLQAWTERSSPGDVAWEPLLGSALLVTISLGLLVSGILLLCGRAEGRIVVRDLAIVLLLYFAYDALVTPRLIRLYYAFAWWPGLERAEVIDALFTRNPAPVSTRRSAFPGCGAACRDRCCRWATGSGHRPRPTSRGHSAPRDGCRPRFR